MSITREELKTMHSIVNYAEGNYKCNGYRCAFEHDETIFWLYDKILVLLNAAVKQHKISADAAGAFAACCYIEDEWGEKIPIHPSWKSVENSLGTELPKFVPEKSINKMACAKSLVRHEHHIGYLKGDVRLMKSKKFYEMVAEDLF